MSGHISSPRRVKNRHSEVLTSTGTVVLFKALISEIEAASGLTTKYKFSDAENLSNLQPKVTVTVAGCSDAANNGDFEVKEVSDTAGDKYLLLYNSSGVADAAPAATSFCTYSFRKNLQDVAAYMMGGFVPEAKDAVVCTYDVSNNLTKAEFYKGGTGGTKLCEINFTYDAAGNMLTAERG